MLYTHMMCLATRDVSQPLFRAQCRIKSVAFLLRTGILPIRAERVREGLLELVDQALLRLQVAQQLLSGQSPVDAAVLLTRARNALDLLKGRPFLCQALEHQVYRLQPHGYRRVDFPLSLVAEDALLDSILG